MNKWDFNSDTVSGSVVLEAKWIDNSPPPSISTPAAVTFENEGTLIDEYKQILEVGDKITEPADVLHKDGYTFDGWYDGANKWNFNTPVTVSMVLKAKWIVNSLPSNPPPPVANKTKAHFYKNSDESSSEGINVKVELPDIDLTKNLIEVNNDIKYFLNKDILRRLKGNGEKTLILKRYGYTWIINGNDISNIDEAGYFNYNIDGMLYSKEKIDNLIKDETDISSNELQYIKMQINEPKVPVRAITTYSVDKKYNGLNMYLYRYNTELDRLEIVEPNIKVKDNNVNFHVTYGGDYILVKKPLKNAWGSFWSEVGDGQLEYIDNGAISIGFKKIENNNYYFNEKGIMQKGWIQVNNKWYFMDEKGVMKTGWFIQNNKWYYFNLNSGVMETGWIYVNYKWYYMDDNGIMRTEWLKYKNDWYYLDLYIGEMKIGWDAIRDKWYFLNDDGTLAVDTSIDGYLVNINGEWVN